MNSLHLFFVRISLIPRIGRYAARYMRLTLKGMSLWGIRAETPQEFEEQVAGTPLKYEALACEAEKRAIAKLLAGEP